MNPSHNPATFAALEVFRNEILAPTSLAKYFSVYVILISEFVNSENIGLQFLASGILKSATFHDYF